MKPKHFLLVWLLPSSVLKALMRLFQQGRRTPDLLAQLLVLICSLLVATYFSGNADGKESKQLAIAVAPSLICDRCTILNAFSDDAVFSRGYEEERKLWLAQLTRTPKLKSAFQTWQGHGVPLAYFMNSSPDTVKLFKSSPSQWRQLVESKSIEPAYKPELEFTLEHRAELLAIFASMDQSGFDDWWYKYICPQLQKNSKEIKQELITKINEASIETVNKFISCSALPLDPKRLPEIYTGFFNNPYSFNLCGRQACLRHDLDPQEAPPIVLHEWLHLFNPSQKVIELHHKIEQEDSFYAEDWQRIYVEGKEGEEEEFVIAADLYTSVQNGVTSRKTALRHLKNSYGGLPLSGLLFDRLISTNPTGLPEHFDYNKFLEDSLSAPGFNAGLKKEFKSLIEPVSGVAGMKLSKKRDGVTVVQVFPSSAAAEADIQEDDILETVNSQPCTGLSMSQTIDLISGRPGDSFDLTVLRHGKSKELHATLK